MDITKNATYLVTPDVDTENFSEVRDRLDVECELVMSLHDPRVVLIDNFLTSDECDTLVEQQLGRLERSGVSDREKGSTISDYRTSMGRFIQHGETEIVERIEKRLENLTLWSNMKTESMNFLEYRPGMYFKRHFDFAIRDDGEDEFFKHGGQRVGTVILYLNDTHGEGSTEFDKVKLHVYPKKGSLLFFAYPQAIPECKTSHVGHPPRTQTKYVMVKWFRERFTCS